MIYELSVFYPKLYENWVVETNHIDYFYQIHK